MTQVPMQITLEGGFRPTADHYQFIEAAVEQGLKSFSILPSGEVISSENQVTLQTGPVVGDVTSDQAIILVEVYCQTRADIDLTCNLYEASDPETVVNSVTEMVKSGRPSAFTFLGLTASTRYRAVFVGVTNSTTAHFKTKPEVIDTFKLLALSCDRPSRLLLGQLDPWKAIARSVKSGRVDAVLHIGDQIYPDDENIEHAAKIFTAIYDNMNSAKQADMMSRARELWRKKYRRVFTNGYKRLVLSGTSNLMIWSDNDVANDFTTLKREDGEQMYHPAFLKCGMEVYRDYQRRLWDPQCDSALDTEAPVQEWYSKTYGSSVGLFFFDIRGNRISSNGVQASENNLLSDQQWSAFEEFLSQPNLRAVMLVSETPFIGEVPSGCRAKVEQNSSMDFLRDHWYFNEEELIRLVEMCFHWKAAAENRDVLLIAGDIHCGVTSVITDEDTGLQINHYTTSPVTNHVCDFFPPLHGSLNERFHFSHLPLGKNFRNYLDVDVRLDKSDTCIKARLVPVSTDIFKNPNWRQASE